MIPSVRSRWERATPSNVLEGLTERSRRFLFLGVVVCALVCGCQNAVSSSAPSDVDSVGAERVDASISTEGPKQVCVDTKLPIPVETTCYFEVPPAPPGQEIDVESLDLRFSGYNGDAELEGTITRIAAPMDCKPMGAEWYYYDESNGTLLVLCSNACGIGSQGGQGLLWVRANCL